MKQFLNKYKGPIILFITALFWGTTFVAQSLGSDYVGAFTYNALRFITTGVILFIITIIRSKKNKKEEQIIDKKQMVKIYILATLVGIFIFLGATFQQLGIQYTKSPAKSGFISTLYMVFVPIIGLCFKKKINKIIWLFLFIALVGSYLIAIDKEFNVELGDILTLICAVSFAFQIVFIDLVNPYMDSIKLSAIQFMIAGALSTIIMLCIETIDFNLIYKALPAIMYAAIFSGCIAFTLQIEGQKYTNPTIAAMIMGLESVIALISGLIILKDIPTPRVTIGCILIFVAVILAQIDFKSLKKKSTKD